MLKLGDGEKYEPDRGKEKTTRDEVLKIVGTLCLRLSSIDVESFAALRNSVNKIALFLLSLGFICEDSDLIGVVHAILFFNYCAGVMKKIIVYISGYFMQQAD